MPPTLFSISGEGASRWLVAQVSVCIRSQEQLLTEGARVLLEHVPEEAGLTWKAAIRQEELPCGGGWSGGGRPPARSCGGWVSVWGRVGGGSHIAGSAGKALGGKVGAVSWPYGPRREVKNS